MPRPAPTQSRLLLMAAVLMCSIGALAGINLWVLRTLHRQAVHTTAAETVLQAGKRLAAYLASQPMVQAEEVRAEHWNEFSRLARLVGTIEPAVGYVSVREGDAILYHEPLSGAAGGMGSGGLSVTPFGPRVRLGRELLNTARGVVPVITFTAPVVSSNGTVRAVQVAVRKDAVEQEEAAAARALAFMFRLSLGTIIGAFVLAIGLVGWLLHSEQQRERRRRDEEHLAFAGLLADGIVHDVRNPLSSLRLDIQMLQKELEKDPTGRRPERLQELAARACRTLERLDTIMREFLYVSKPGPAERERVEVNACLQDCLDLLGPRFERLGVHLAVDLAPERLPILGFDVGLKRALINILTNAKQASPPGATVHVSTRRDNGWALVEIRDEGPGIPRSELRRVFGMFVSGRPGGLGLGLALAKTAVESCGGTIWAENVSGGGARFVIRLPLALESDQDVEPGGDTGEKTHGHERKGEGARH